MPLTTECIRGADAAKERLTVNLAGSLDTATAPDLEKQLAAHTDAATRHVVFDLAKLTLISSAGLRVFAATRKMLKERNGQVTIVNAQPQIQAVFDVIKALPGMSIFKDVAELDAYLAARQKATLED